MESVEFHQAAALLAWQLELGADEAICDAPVDRYALPAAMTKPAAKAKAEKAPSGPVVVPDVDGVAIAREMAAAAGDLAGLQAAIAAFEHCDLKRGARKMVFGDGSPAARVMIIGDVPDRDEDREGRPFVGRSGQLLDRMFEAIGMGRAVEDTPVYLANVLPWRPPQGRDPKPDEMAMMQPFLERHIALVNPDILVLMGNISCQALLGKRGITRLRGEWQEVLGKPALPMFHPSHLMRTPLAKRDAWADLLSLKARLKNA
ncbi:uracil-DNA glycosylase family protein [Pseudosulfitobacter sp. SM2401]|uniref:uracil-DNA glycosylase n=1 Tax=Pseudosulfitobacter sp. SM2401 TaxID=3350098 RepID=UPI0036F3D000